MGANYVRGIQKFIGQGEQRGFSTVFLFFKVMSSELKF